jgi:integrase
VPSRTFLQAYAKPNSCTPENERIGSFVRGRNWWTERNPSKSVRQSAKTITKQTGHFASPTTKSKQPLWPETLWRRYGRPAVETAKIQKRVGFHTFRHTYTTLLTQNNEEVKVVQELLRHANSRITMDLYAQAGMPNKRLTQSKLVRMALNKGEALA